MFILYHYIIIILYIFITDYQLFKTKVTAILEYR